MGLLLTKSCCLCAYRRIAQRAIQICLAAAITLGCLLALAAAVNGGERPPPLQGGVEQWEPERPQAPGRPAPRQAICESYAASVAQRSGRIQDMPKAGGGPGPLPQGGPIREYCLAPNANWTLLGEDRNYCCFFAPNEWTPKFPLPGNIQKDQPIPDRRPSPPPWDGPFPWEQPAQAQPARNPVGTANITVTWNSSPNENRDHRQRSGWCGLSIDFYSDRIALAKNYNYQNDDIYRIYSERIERERIHGGPATFQFRSGLTISPKNNNSYDIAWQNPTLDSIQDHYYRFNGDTQWREQSTAGSPAYNAYCVGRSVGPVGANPAVQVRLIGVGLVDTLRPTLQRDDSYTIILNNLQKQAPRATVTMNWSFPQRPMAQQNLPR